MKRSAALFFEKVYNGFLLAEEGAGGIQNSVEHIKWSFLEDNYQPKSVNNFCKKHHLRSLTRF